MISFGSSLRTLCGTLSLSAAVVLAAGLGVQAAVPPAAGSAPAATVPPKASATVSPEVVAGLIRQLDDDSFGKREAASHRLGEIGAPAIPGLQQAVVGKSLEASTRAFFIFKKFLGSSDTKLQDAARDALQKIARQRDAAKKKKDEALEAAAARAHDLLADFRRTGQNGGDGEALVPPPLFNGGLAPGQFGGGAIINGGVLILPGGPGGVINGPMNAQVLISAPILRSNRVELGKLEVQQGVGAMSVSVSVTDGTRHVEVSETQGNGDKKQTKIVSDPKAGIKIEVTTTKNGKDTTEKFESPDAKTLEKDHPDAYKIFEKYGGDGAGQGGVIIALPPPILP